MQQDSLNADELHRVVDGIDASEYPLTGDDLAERAEDLGASENSVDFFESLGEMQVESPEELDSVIEQVSDDNLRQNDGDEDSQSA